jgi:hypothetical protein
MITCAAIVVLCCGITGCGGGSKTNNAYAECALSRMDTGKYRLLSTAVGTRIGDDKKPTTDPNGPAVNRTVVHVLAGGPSYVAMIRSTYNGNDPVRKMQAQYVGWGVQLGYPFLNVLDGTTYITGDAPAGQTEHVAAGSESTAFIIEVDHNNEQNDKSKWIHRIYVVEVKDHICVWAQQYLNAPRPAYGTPVKQGQFIECKYNDNKKLWELNDPKPFASDVDRKNAVDETLGLLGAAGL